MTETKNEAVVRSLERVKFWEWNPRGSNYRGMPELVSSLALLAARPRGMPAWAAWAGVALVGIAWASTAFVQVPLHGTLARGFDEDAHARLVATNWVRTVAWSGHAVLMAWCMVLLLGGTPPESRP